MFYSFYGTRRFIAVLTKARPEAVHSTAPHSFLFTTHRNDIFQCMHTFSQILYSLPTCIARAKRPTHLILVLLHHSNNVSLIFSWRSFPQLLVTLSRICHNLPLTTPSPVTGGQILNGRALYLGALSVEPAGRHPSGAYNSEMAPTFLRNLWIPVSLVRWQLFTHTKPTGKGSLFIAFFFVSG